MSKCNGTSYAPTALERPFRAALHTRPTQRARAPDLAPSQSRKPKHSVSRAALQSDRKIPNSFNSGGCVKIGRREPADFFDLIGHLVGLHIVHGPSSRPGQ